MKIMMSFIKQYIFVSVFCLMVVGLFSSGWGYVTENVFLVVIDGSRQSETFFDSTHQYIPHIWNELRPMGSINTSFSNNNLTETNPGHATLESGVWQNILNNGSQRPTSPTVFEYLRKQLGTAATLTWVVAGKSKLNILSYSTVGEYGSAYGASVSAVTRSDTDTWTALQSVMDTNHPKLVVVNLASTDSAGHVNSWGGYTSAIVKADMIVANLWSKITSDAMYKNKTSLIVTNDHGRHDDSHGGFSNHGDTCNGCKQLLFLAVGPDFKSNYISPIPRTQIDMAPTIGNLLGFDTPLSEAVS
jgi:hypothetical protein